MKKFIFIILTSLALATSSDAGWFNDDNHQHEQQLEQQVQQEQQHSNNQGGVIIVLSIGCIITLVVGTMIGSKTRRASNEKQ